MTQTATTTFARTHALYIASKVAADLRQMQIFYSKPTDDQIRAYADEFVEHLVAGHVKTVEYGFKRDGAWVISLRYEVRADGTVTDTGSGRVYPHADVSGLGFSSYLIKQQTFWLLSEAEQGAFLAKLPFQREGADEPQHLNGYWDTGKSYSAGGVGAVRQQWRPV